MPWADIEIEYTCPVCKDVCVEYDSILSNNSIMKDIESVMGTRYCLVCDAYIEQADSMVVTRMAIPLIDNFGASIF